MMPITTILVGVDHSERSDKALRKANELALNHNGRLVLQHALDTSALGDLTDALDRTVAAETTKRAAAALRGEQRAPILATRADAGRPSEVLQETAKTHNADLIVIGAERRDNRWFDVSGSTAKRLASAAPAPVLIVTDEPTNPYAQILVAVDGSDAAGRALQFALQLAPRAQIAVVTAYAMPHHIPATQPELADDFERDARSIMSKTLTDLLAPRVLDQIDQVSRFGEPLGVILAETRERKPDLLVLGTAKSELLRYVFGGGITHQIITDPPCDLLIVRS